MTVGALLWTARDFWGQGRYFLVGLDVLILGATIWVALESLGALARARKEPKEADA